MATFTTRHSARRPGARDVRHAWFALATFPVALAGALVVGEGLSSLLGYTPGDDAAAPWWVIATASVPALLIAAAPAVAATWFAQRAAAAAKDRRGWIPAAIGLGATGLFILTNILAAIFG